MSTSTSGQDVAERLQHRKEPVETGMALDGDMQPPRLARPEPLELLLQRRQPRQHILRQPQQLQPRRREPHRPRPPHEQLHPRLVLQPLDLVAERALRDVQPIRRARQPALLVDGLDRPQVPKLDMHTDLILILKIMKLPQDPLYATSTLRHFKDQNRHADPRVSFEFFPPKSLEASFRLWDTLGVLAPLDPPSSPSPTARAAPRARSPMTRSRRSTRITACPSRRTSPASTPPAPRRWRSPRATPRPA
jgi:hypothetical protein